MLRRSKHRSPLRMGSKKVIRRQHSFHRMSTLLMDNPVNQAAFWSQDTFSLEELVSYHPLPKIVRCVSQMLPGEEKAVPIDIHVPMLLCAGRTSQKLLAKHVGYEARGHKLTETEDTIVIPSDYNGNFLRLQARTTKDQSERKTLMQIAENNAPAFLTLSPIVAFYQTQVASTISTTGNNKLEASSVQSGGSSHVTSKLSRLSKTTTTSVVQRRMILPPGSVFLITGISKGVASTKKKKREVTLLKCTDPKGNHVLISADQQGEFVEVIPQGHGESRLSMKSSDLIVTNVYPSLVRFVYGDHVPRLTPCSYLFTLVDTFKEESLIGCVMYQKHAVMIELPLASSLRFQVALNTEELLDLELPKHAKETVQARRESFLTDLKLKCRFLHRINQGDGIDGNDELMSATVRTRQYANESFFYL